MNSQWTEARIERCRKLWEDGATAEAIAKKLGDGATRCAVIGKMKRIWAQRGTASPMAAAAGIPKAAAPTLPKASAPTRPKAPAQPRLRRVAPLRELPPERTAAPVCRHLTIADLTATTCRFPLGDPADAAFRYCGAEAPVERPYCLHHARIAFTQRKAYG
jgi:GcrA cell cycle regulator